MHPFTHLLLSWTAADLARVQPRDRALLVCCGVAPDLDGLGLVVDLANEALGRPDTEFYHTYHHFLSHGLPAALLVPALICLFAREKWRVLLLGVWVFHLHLLCDLLGSRGPAPSDLWPIYYLAPWARQPMWVWPGQWRLDGWQNLAVSVAALGFVLWRAVACGYSPVSLVSRRADEAVVAALRRRWQKLRPQ